MMAGLDEKTLLAAELFLQRPLRDEERLEIYRISDIFGMRDVQSFLHLILVFKLHEETMKNSFAAISALEEKIQITLESSVDRILGEGAKRIGADIGAAVGESARETLTAVGAYHSVRGQTLLICLMSLTSMIAYWLGSGGFLSAFSSGSLFDSLMFFPAGWSMFLCGVTYTFFWLGDHWERVKLTKLYKTLLGLQVFFLLVLFLNLI